MWKPLLLLLLLAGCASLPPDLETIRQEVNTRVTYKHYVGKNYTAITGNWPKYLRPKGNCAVFAATYAYEAKLAGHKDVEVVACYLPSGEGHAYARVGEWALDNRYDRVIHINQEDCR